MRTINEIIIHCSATPEGRHVTVDDIDGWHRSRGFRCVGYHYIVYLDGTVVAGRSESETGAHCQGHNSRSIGICYVGGCSADGLTPKDTRTPAQRQSIATLLQRLKEKYLDAEIRVHRDFAAKACPSFDATAEYNNNK